MNNLALTILASLLTLVFIPCCLWFYIYGQMKDHKKKSIHLLDKFLEE